MLNNGELDSLHKDLIVQKTLNANFWQNFNFISEMELWEKFKTSESEMI